MNMKRINLYLLPALLTVILFSGCRQDDGSYDNKVYNITDKVGTLLIKGSIVNDERTIQAALAKPAEQDVVITYKVDPSLLSVYNAAYNEHAVILPAEHYEIPEPKVTITAGSVRSTEVVVYFKNINELNRELVYVLPVAMASANIEMLESARVTYYVLKGAALINVVADLEDNYLNMTAWQNAGVVNNLTKLTLEALIRARDYDRQISTVMGIEGRFLIRLGDANFPSNQIQVATSAGNFPSSDANKGLPVNEWTHIAVTFDITDGSKYVIYVNGKVQSEGTRTGLSSVSFGTGGASGFYIGRSYADDRFLAGEFSECRIWNTVRTQEEIAANIYEVDPANEPNLVA
jgi:hypothetical protein